MKKILFKAKGSEGSFPAAKTPQFMGIAPWSIPKYVEWLPQLSPIKEDFFFYMDNAIKEGLSVPGLKYGILYESRPYLDGPRTWGWVVEDLKKNQNLYKQHYKYIFTCWMDLVELGPPFAYRFAGGLPHTPIEHRKIYEKTKLLSMLIPLSRALPIHEVRIAYAEKYKHCADIYGRGRPTELSRENYHTAFKDYMFTVMFENFDADLQFSEKLTDPMVNGSVPVTYGSKAAVSKYFDERGVLWAQEINPEKDLTPALYKSMLPYIKTNFDIACNIPTMEDYIYEQYLSKELK